MQALMHPQLPVVLPGHILFAAVVQLFDLVLKGSAFGYTMLAAVMLFGQALYLNSIALRYKLFNKSAYVVTFLYLLFSSLAPGLSYFSEPLMINWCMLGVIDLLIGFHQTSQPRKHIFNAGFIMCTAAVFYFPAITYILLLIIALVLFRSFSIAEWTVALLGFLTPLYFFAGVLFLVDKLPELKNWVHIEMVFNEKMPGLLYVIGTVLGIITLFGCSVFVLQEQIGRISVFMRRNWIMIASYLFISVLVATDAYFSIKTAWLIVMPALSLIIANAFYLEKSKVFSNFVFYFSLILVIFAQLTINN
jgi:hypothetical protein